MSPISTLTPGELEQALQKIPRWSLEEGALTCTWVGDDFRTVQRWVNAIADLAEEQCHHPDLYWSYNRLRLRLMTHDSAAITSKDVALAQSIDRIGPQSPNP